MKRFAYVLTVFSLLALLALCLLWEMWLAPVRPGGSWLALKALPLLLLWRGILYERFKTYQLSSLLVWAYFTEGVMRAFADKGWSRALAGGEIALSLLLFIGIVLYVRSGRGEAAI